MSEQKHPKVDRNKQRYESRIRSTKKKKYAHKTAFRMVTSIATEKKTKKGTEGKEGKMVAQEF